MKSSVAKHMVVSARRSQANRDFSCVDMSCAAIIQAWTFSPFGICAEMIDDFFIDNIL